jgi:copper chaperone CopZ
MNGTRFRLILRLHEIRCAGCLNTIEGALRRQGAESIRIDLASHIAVIVYRGLASDADAFGSAVRAAGYRATLLGVLPQFSVSDETDAREPVDGSSLDQIPDKGV